MTAITDMGYQQSIAAAVRAEFARRGFKLSDLASAIGRSRPTAADNWHGRRGFTMEELERVANFLGISPYDLNDSAAFGQRFNDDKPRPIEVARITPPHDPWPQPSRSKRRA